MPCECINSNCRLLAWADCFIYEDETISYERILCSAEVNKILIKIHKDAGHIKEMLDHLYKAKAKSVFLKRLEHVLSRALWVTEIPNFRVIKMQTQWGSCSPQGILVLNPYLVKAPTQCIDYVILHELCHLAEHNHSERFYQLMSQVMPDWESRKELLDNMAARLFS